ncbi:MAG: hypothetical protein AAB522_01505 [Patescibacteria group bacterium]|mgnify:CR=1 FL=1
MEKKDGIVVETLQQAQEALRLGKVHIPLNVVPSYVLEQLRHNPIRTEKEFDEVIQRALDISPVGQALLIEE